MSLINSATAAFLRRFGSVHEAKGRHVDVVHFKAQCPACNFRHHLSLSIWVLGNGRVIVHCFECEDTPSIMQALGMEVGDLDFPHTKDTRLSQNIQSIAVREVMSESAIIIAAAQKLAAGLSLSELDHSRLVLAMNRIAEASDVMASPGKPK